MAQPARLSPALTVLGSGTAGPRADRGTSAYLFSGGLGGQWRVDLGPGVLQRAARAGCSLTELTGVLVTHVHPDHSADLAALAFGLCSPALAWRRAPVEVCGEARVGLLLARLRNAWPGWLNPGAPRLIFRPVQAGPLPWPGTPRITAFGVAHHASSLGYRVELPDGFVLAFSGDTGEGGELEALGRDADLFVLEAAASERRPIPGHLTPRQAGAIAARAGARTLLLTHFYPDVLEDPIEEQARETFEGRLLLAEDGLRLPLVR